MQFLGNTITLCGSLFLFTQGFVKGYQATNLVAMADSEMFKGADLRSPGAPKSAGVYGRRNNDMTDQHRAQLHLLKERDMQIV